MTQASERILFIPPKTLTGAAQSLAAAREIRRVHRKAKIVCLTTAALAPLFDASPYFNSIDPDGDPQNWKEALAVLRRLRGAPLSAVYDLRGSAMIGRMRHGLKPKPGFWSSPEDAFTFAAHDAGEGEEKLHALERMELQLVAAGVLDQPAGLVPDLGWLSAAGRNTRTLEPAYFGLNDPYAVLLPCTTAREKSPAFKPEEWAALAAALFEQGLRPAVLGSVADRPTANAVRTMAPQAKDFLGRTNLLQLAALCRRSRIVIGSLAPAAHLAAAAGADMVTVFAAGDPAPRASAPRGEGTVIALTPAPALGAPAGARVSIGDVMQSARALGAFRRETARVDA